MKNRLPQVVKLAAVCFFIYIVQTLFLLANNIYGIVFPADACECKPDRDFVKNILILKIKTDNAFYKNFDSYKKKNYSA